MRTTNGPDASPIVTKVLVFFGTLTPEQFAQLYGQFAQATEDLQQRRPHYKIELTVVDGYAYRVTITADSKDVNWFWFMVEAELIELRLLSKKGGQKENERGKARALILWALGSGPRTIRDIARTCWLPIPTVSRNMKELADEGRVVIDDSPRAISGRGRPPTWYRLADGAPRQ